MGMCPWPPSEFQGNIIKSSSTIKKTILYDFVTQTIMILCLSPSSVAFLFPYVGAEQLDSVNIHGCGIPTMNDPRERKLQKKKKRSRRRKEMLRWYLKGTVALLYVLFARISKLGRRKRCAGGPRFTSAWFTPNQTMCDLLRAEKVTTDSMMAEWRRRGTARPRSATNRPF